MKHLVTVIGFDMPNRIKNHYTELGGFVTSALGVITAQQEQIGWWSQFAATVIAIVAGALSIYSFLLNRWKNKKAVKALLEVMNSRESSPEEKEQASVFWRKLVENKTIKPEDLV